MAYKEITFEQLQGMVSTTEAAQALKKVKKVVADLYGPSVKFVEIDADGEYNDEGGTDYYARHLEVYDKDNNTVEYDFTTSFWQKQIKKYKLNVDELKDGNLNEDIENEISDMICSLSDERLNYGHKYDLSLDAKNMPKVYIEE